jgi:hypothetical protein
LSLSVIEPWVIAGGAGGAALAGGGILLYLKSRSRDPAEIERQRRNYLNRIGRITDGRILEYVERATVELEGNRNVKRAEPEVRCIQRLLCYAYAVAGVRYETAQDVTGLEARMCLRNLVAGQAASVKYDPANPGNSILIADNWSGVR